jgi:hypothetical protein
MSKEKKNQIDKKTRDAEITNALTDEFDRFEHFALTKWKQIVWSGVLIIVIVAVIFGTKAIQKSADRSAAAALSNAKTIEEIDKALVNYPNHKADISARLRLVKIYLDKKDYKNVFAQYAALKKMEIPKQLRARMRLDAAYILEVQKDYAGAIKKFSAIGADTLMVDEAYRCEANYGAGRLSAQTKKWNDAARYLSLSKNTVVSQINFQAVDFFKSQATFMYDRLAADGKIKKIALPPKQVVKPIIAVPGKSLKPATR